MNVMVVGHAAHGKSTLIGRLVHDTGSLPEGKIERIRAACERRGVPFEWAFVIDGPPAAGDEAVVLDAAPARFRTDLRDYVVIDAPSPGAFVENMVAGCASADVGILVIDAAQGMCEQSCRHGYLLRVLGVRRLAVVVTKMDLVGYTAARFDEVARECRARLERFGVRPTHVIPVAPREGGNVAEGSRRMAWYEGPTVVEALDSWVAPPPAAELPLRLPVQDVVFRDDCHIVAGRIETGSLAVGDELLFSPSNTTARVTAIEGSSRDAAEAFAGDSVALTLDKEVLVARGEVASHLDRPPIETNVFRAHLFWGGRAPLTAGRRYTLKLNTAEVAVEVQTIESVVDTRDAAADRVERGDVAEVVLRTSALIALDEFTESPPTGRFVLIDGSDVAGGGIINMEGYPDQRGLVTVKGTNLGAVEHRISGRARAVRNRHWGGVLWFTGLSGSGKSTLAIEVEQRLFRKGYFVYVLDGDNVRRGLNANLGFSPEDRAENIRRVGEVAALFADGGVIVIAAFISPYISDRARARSAAGDQVGFHEVHIKADLELCEQRDPKGLYKKARRGEIQDFTGVSAPYEPPDKPDLVVDTGAGDIDHCAARIVSYVERHFALTVADRSSE